MIALKKFEARSTVSVRARMYLSAKVPNTTPKEALDALGMSWKEIADLNRKYKTKKEFESNWVFNWHEAPASLGDRHAWGICWEDEPNQNEWGEVSP